ncbi:MAG: transketolase, partial [Actinomycetota bacterium]|nr:transketolase [Actinomycetota bacterium]
MTNDVDARAINVVRGLAMDAVQAANSGHPGTPMALAPLAHVLYTRILRYDAGDPEWPDRDRFVLSAGHASMLLYAMLHLTGYGLTLDDLRAFRQWGSRTPGHPEYGHAPGIESTTGPLGQGFGNGVGMAIAEEHLRSRFGPEVCDHRTFAICSDGDLMEGVSHEAASLAGHLKLGRLVYVYDDNHITIDGKTELALSDEAGRRFEAYGWHVLRLGEVADDLDALERGLRDAMAEEERPSLVILRSHIGYPSPKFTDTPEAHGAPLGADEVAKVKEILGMPAGERFWVPDDVAALYREAGSRGRKERQAWLQRLQALRLSQPELAEEYEACLAGQGRPGWEAKLPSWPVGESVATRVACSDVLGAIADLVPGLFGGGADLTGNTGTKLKGFGVFSPEDRKGRQMYFGVREHGMGSS